MASVYPLPEPWYLITSLCVSVFLNAYYVYVMINHDPHSNQAHITRLQNLRKKHHRIICILSKTSSKKSDDLCFILVYKLQWLRSFLGNPSSGSTMTSWPNVSFILLDGTPHSGWREWQCTTPSPPHSKTYSNLNQEKNAFTGPNTIHHVCINHTK